MFNLRKGYPLRRLSNVYHVEDYRCRRDWKHAIYILISIFVIVTAITTSLIHCNKQIKKAIQQPDEYYIEGVIEYDGK